MYFRYLRSAKITSCTGSNLASTHGSSLNQGTHNTKCSSMKTRDICHKYVTHSVEWPLTCTSKHLQEIPSVSFFYLILLLSNVIQKQYKILARHVSLQSFNKTCAKRVEARRRITEKQISNTSEVAFPWNIGVYDLMSIFHRQWTRLK